MNNPWQNIKFYSYRVRLLATENIYLPNFSGSTLRGAFGHALRKVSCMSKMDNHQNCILKNKCPYFLSFETTRKDTPSGLRTYPHPFILEPPINTRKINAGNQFDFKFVLIGKAVNVLPYFILAFNQMGSVGLGKGRGKFELLDVSTYPQSRIIYNSKDNDLTDGGDELSIKKMDIGNCITLNFLTPTRLKEKGKYIMVPSFEAIVRASLRRMSLLANAYCDTELDLPYGELIEEARSIRIVRDGTNPCIINRYSSRQERKVPLHGITGSVDYEGDFTPFAELLDAIRWLHLGGATAFGFGNVKVERVEG